MSSRDRAWETGKGKNQRSGPSTVIFPLRVNLKEGISNIGKCVGVPKTTEAEALLPWA